MIMKKILATAFCLSALFAYTSLLKSNNSVSVLSEDVEALSACDVSCTNAKGEFVKFECVGEKGTCIIDEKVEVKVEVKVKKVGKITKVVETKLYAACSGTRVS